MPGYVGAWIRGVPGYVGCLDTRGACIGGVPEYVGCLDTWGAPDTFGIRVCVRCII